MHTVLTIESNFIINVLMTFTEGAGSTKLRDLSILDMKRLGQTKGKGNYIKHCTLAVKSVSQGITVNYGATVYMDTGIK